jgi:hypothetical protein
MADDEMKNVEYGRDHRMEGRDKNQEFSSILPLIL